MKLKKTIVNKRGQEGLGNILMVLLLAAIVVTVVMIGLGLGSQISRDLSNNYNETTQAVQWGIVQNATKYGEDAMGTYAQQTPTFALVIASSTVLVILIVFMMRRVMGLMGER